MGHVPLRLRIPPIRDETNTALAISAQLRICLRPRALGEIVTFGIFVGVSLLLQVASSLA